MTINKALIALAIVVVLASSGCKNQTPQAKDTQEYLVCIAPNVERIELEGDWYFSEGAWTNLDKGFVDRTVFKQAYNQTCYTERRKIINE